VGVYEDLIFEFNHLRRHGDLNYETPFDELPNITELLSQYNSALLRNFKKVSQ
jgi:hypothetical protein